MGTETAWAIDEKEPDSPVKRAGITVRKTLRKYVYLLPSGRKMTVILDDEPEPKPAIA